MTLIYCCYVCCASWSFLSPRTDNTLYSTTKTDICEKCLPLSCQFYFFLTEHTTGVYIKHCYTLVDAEKTFIIFGVESDHSSYVKMYILWTLAIFLVQWDSVHWILSGHLRRSSFCVVFCISCHHWELDQHAEYELVFLLLSVVPHPYPHFPRVGGGDR